MRILVDGLDLSGKTTLVTTLIDTLATHRVPAVRHRGMLAEHHPLERLLKRLPLAYQSQSSLITGAGTCPRVVDNSEPGPREGPSRRHLLW
ncbi:hypothetical protein AB0E67_35780 [Streptomyces sp. NPDC032161]|uniref:hypothetical protein n=1 Tax=unclassified Streptomyces TaxID=2593676 RepID=UPI0033EEEEAD